MSQIATHPAPTLSSSEAERPVKPALWLGWQRRCPACGEGKLMAGFLKVADHCPECGEDFTPQRADDGPAYITILVVGKTVITLYLMVYLAYEFSPTVMIALTWTIALAMSAWLLPRIKGAMVAFQWAKRMHGFASPAAPAQDASLAASAMDPLRAPA